MSPLYASSHLILTATSFSTCTHTSYFPDLERSASQPRDELVSGCLKGLTWGTWLAQFLGEHMTLDVGVVSLNPTLGVEPT